MFMVVHHVYFEIHVSCQFGNVLLSSDAWSSTTGAATFEWSKSLISERPTANRAPHESTDEGVPSAGRLGLVHFVDER